MHLPHITEHLRRRGSGAKQAMPLASRNGLWETIGSLSLMAAAGLGSLFTVRGLTPAQYGTFSYYAWGGATLLALVSAALPISLTKVSAELRGRKDEQAARDLTALVGAIVSLLSSVAALGALLWALRGGPDRVYLLIIAAFLVPASIALVLAADLRGHERYRPVSVVDVGCGALQLVLIAAAFIAHLGPPGYLAAVLIPPALNLPVLLLFRRRVLGGNAHSRGGRRRRMATLVRPYLSYAVPATLAFVFEIVIWQRSELFFLQYFSSSAEVGFYSLAFTVFAVFLALGRAIVNGFFPAVSRDFGAGDWTGIRDKMRQAVTAAVLYAVPAGFGGMLVAQQAITLVYGQKMLPSVVVVQILFAGLILAAPGVAYSYLIGAVRGIWLQVRLGAGLSVVSVALDLLLIPRFGAVGAAISNTGVVALYTVLLAVLAWRRYGFVPQWRVMATTVVVGALTTLILPRLIEDSVPGLVGLAAAVAAAAALYIACVLRLGYARDVWLSQSPRSS